MSGWEKVIAATVVAVVGLIAFNVAIWRRMRASVGLAAQVERDRDREVQPE